MNTISTNEILAMRVLEHSVDQRWVDWAVSMLVQGFDSQNLRVLAGETPPFNQFELLAIADHAFNELNLDWSDKNKVVRNYVTELVSGIALGQLDQERVLGKLKDLCIELDYDKSLYDFYLLYFAKTDLKESDVQWYWHGADRNNIDKIILDYCKQWLINKKRNQASF